MQSMLAGEMPVAALAMRRAEGKSNSEMPGRLAVLGDLPHLPISRLDMPPETGGVEQGMGGAVLRQFFAHDPQQCGLARQPQRQRFIGRQDFRVINSVRPSRGSRLAATRPAKAWPWQVSNGTPAQSASLAVVWAL